MIVMSTHLKHYSKRAALSCSTLIHHLERILFTKVSPISKLNTRYISGSISF